MTHQNRNGVEIEQSGLNPEGLGCCSVHLREIDKKQQGRRHSMEFLIGDIWFVAAGAMDDNRPSFPYKQQEHMIVCIRLCMSVNDVHWEPETVSLETISCLLLHLEK